MDSDKRLGHELAELNLLLQGLAKIPDFPAELLELISGKVESIAHLTSNSGSSDTATECTNSVSFQPHSIDPVFADFSICKEEAEDLLSQIPCTPREEATPVSAVIIAEATDDRHTGNLSGNWRSVDFTKSMTLNDRFRFQREFFGNDAHRLAQAFSYMKTIRSLDEALDYLRVVADVDETSDSFQDFCLLLNGYFSDETNPVQSN